METKDLISLPLKYQFFQMLLFWDVYIHKEGILYTYMLETET